MSPVAPSLRAERCRRLGSSSIPSLATPLPTTTAKGSSVGGAAVASPLTITAANNHLSVSVDWGPPVDVVLFPTDVANGGSVSKTTADIATELKNNALPNAGLDATASQTGDVLTIQSNTAGMDSAVVGHAGLLERRVAGPPARPRLGRHRGLRLRRQAGRLPTAARRAVRRRERRQPGRRRPTSCRRAARAGSTRSTSCCFPRFNLLCLPGVTSDDDAQVVERARLLPASERGFLIVDSPTAGFAAIPPNLGALQALGEHGAIYYPRVSRSRRVPGGAARR